MANLSFKYSVYEVIYIVNLSGFEHTDFMEGITFMYHSFWWLRW